MKTGINLLDLYPGKIGGMEQYVRNVIHVLRQDPEMELHVFLNAHAMDTFEVEAGLNRHLVDVSKDRDLQLFSMMQRLDLDIWFCPLLTMEPRYCPIPSVLTIPDIQHEYFPEYFSKDVLAFRRRNFMDSIDKADALITISHFSKQTIVEKYGVDPVKIAVTHLDADRSFGEPEDHREADRVRQQYGLPDSYLFYPSNSWPHKNHATLIRAFAACRSREERNLHLVLTGDRKSQSGEIEAVIAENGLQERVHYLGYIDQAHMPCIYRNALALVFPSVFEGFCIPLVEAMRTNCPILASRCGSIPEIAGDAALFFEARNAADLADQIDRLLQDDGLRLSLIEKGKSRSLQFSWESCAAQTQIVLENTLRRNSPTEWPLVTVVTPSYNQGPFIRDTIESVLSQDYPNIEYLVMDGGSTDETVSILKEYDGRLAWVSERDEGQADAVNKGVARARGAIIGWLNSDDTYMPGAISTAVRFFMKYPDIGMAYGEGWYTDKSGAITERYLTEPFRRDRLAEHCIICQPSAFFRKSTFDSIGGLNKDLHLCMDYDLWMRMAKGLNVAYIPKYLATSRMYEENKTLGRRREVFEEICATVKSHYGYVPVSWAYGYADYLCGGKRGTGFCLRLIGLMLRYNASNSRFLYNSLRDHLKSRLRPAVKRLRARKGGIGTLFEDGWVSSGMTKQFQMHAGMSRIVVQGSHLWPYREALRIRITVDGRRAGIFRIQPKGEFSIETPIAGFGLTPGDGFTVQLSADRTFCPKALGINADERDLSFLLHRLEVT